MAAPKTPKNISEKHALNLDEKSVDKFRLAEESDTISRSAYIGQETPTQTSIKHELKYDSQRFGDKLDVVNINGTEGDDTELRGNIAGNLMHGLDGDDTFYGSRGADELFGGKGNDTANYEDSPSAVEVDLEPGQRGKGGDAKGDRYESIENVIGSGYGDEISGNDKRNTLDGGVGDDELDGRDGSDILIGGTGDDTLIGGAGADHLDGGEEEEIDGDTASYEGSDAAVQVSLASGTATGGHAQGDTLANIENLKGSDYADTLEGDGNANTLMGEGGDDVLIGGLGGDHLQGGAGLDEANYADSSRGVTVDLSGTSSGGTAEGDTYSGVEDARGSRWSDEFHGTSGANRFYGEGGNDTFFGDAGADEFHGGTGYDTANYRDSNARVVVDLEAGTGQGGHAQGDELYSIENLHGSFENDNQLYGSSAGNRIYSYGEDDVVDARGGNDTITATGLFDEIRAGSGDDTIIVYDEEDLGAWDGQGLFPRNRSINGGQDVDTVEFRQSNWYRTDDHQSAPGELVDSHGVNVNLSTNSYEWKGAHYTSADKGTPHRSEGSIAEVENISGTQYRDFITGDGADNTFWGNGGKDSLNGGDGDDTLVGGDGDDYLRGGNDSDTLSGDSGEDELYGGDGDDTLIGGAGADELDGSRKRSYAQPEPDDNGIDTASYEGSDAGVRVSLATGTATGGHAEGDTLVNIENLIGSDHRDRLTGDTDANTLEGRIGNDVLEGGGGNDTLIGGAGADEFIFGSEFHDIESHVTIEDFQIGEDTLNLSHLEGFDSIDDVRPNMEQQGNDTVITYEGSTITLKDTVESELSETDFTL